MSLLRDIIAELEGAQRQPEVQSDVSDEQRIFALMAIQAGAD